MSLVILKSATRQLEKLPKVKQLIVGQKIRTLDKEGGISNVERLSGYKDFFRARVGDYRIVFKKEANTVTVVAIGHRREVYKLFERPLK